MSLEERRDIIVTSIRDLATFFHGKPKTSSIAFTFALQLQELETEIWRVINSRTLDNAVAAQLETLGEIVGEPRLGRTDEEYRTAIRGRILANRSNGQWVDILKLLELMRPEESYDFVEGNATILIVTSNQEHDLDRVVLDFLRDASAAGVAVQMIAPTTELTDTFRLCDASVPRTGTGRGFTEVAKVRHDVNTWTQNATDTTDNVVTAVSTGTLLRYINDTLPETGGRRFELRARATSGWIRIEAFSATPGVAWVDFVNAVAGSTTGDASIISVTDLGNGYTEAVIEFANWIPGDLEIYYTDADGGLSSNVTAGDFLFSIQRLYGYPKTYTPLGGRLRTVL